MFLFLYTLGFTNMILKPKSNRRDKSLQTNFVRKSVVTFVRTPKQCSLCSLIFFFGVVCREFGPDDQRQKIKFSLYEFWSDQERKYVVKCQKR